jgi:hypothetical protein
MKTVLPQTVSAAFVPESGAAVARAESSAGLAAEDIRTAVHSFWERWRCKSVDGFSDAYATSSICFRANSVTAEPAFLGIAQRSREYFHEACIMEMDLGPIEVVLLNETTGIAVYTFHFRAVNRAMAAGGKLEAEDMPQGRATQVFCRNGEGKLKILHEHISSASG